MNRYGKIIFAALLPALFASGGCGDRKNTVEESPVERNQLVIRMFQSMIKPDPVSAAAQAAKLRALDPGNAYFTWIIEQQECNRAVQMAQKALNDLRPADAVEILQAVRKRYPLHHELDAQLQLAIRLHALQQAVRLYCDAGLPAEKERHLKVVSAHAEALRNHHFSAAVIAQEKLLQRAASPAAQRKF